MRITGKNNNRVSETQKNKINVFKKIYIKIISKLNKQKSYLKSIFLD